MADSTPGSLPGVGIDLIEIERVEAALRRRPRLRGRLFTEAELAHCESRARPGRHLAARFAAKEAVIKTLGGGFGPGSVEISGSEPPRVVLSGRALAIARAHEVEVTVSLTHDRRIAAAAAIARPPS